MSVAGRLVGAVWDRLGVPRGGDVLIETADEAPGCAIVTRLSLDGNLLTRVHLRGPEREGLGPLVERHGQAVSAEVARVALWLDRAARWPGRLGLVLTAVWAAVEVGTTLSATDPVVGGALLDMLIADLRDWILPIARTTLFAALCRWVFGELAASLVVRLLDGEV